MINEAILTLQECGELQQIKKRWWHDFNKKKKCSESREDNDAESLGLNSIGGVFAGLVLGLCLAICIAIFEKHCIKNNQNQIENNNSLNGVECES